MTSITIPSKVASIGNYAFQGCQSLTSVIIEEGVTGIGNYAFSSCGSLKSIAIPSSVKNIGNYAFDHCSVLTSVSLEKGLTGIGENAFYYCRNLTSVNIPEGVTSIGTNAFSWCRSLQSVTIPSSVESIGNYAFYLCDSLKSVVSLAEEPFEIADGVFIGASTLNENITYENATLYVPQGAKESYQATSAWNKFYNIVESGNYVTVSIINEEGFATYCPTVGVDFSSTTKIAAYKGSVIHSTNTVELTRIEKVSAGEGVLICSVDGGAVDAEVSIAIEATKNEGNEFVGTLKDIVLAETDGDFTNFVLSKKNDVVSFYKANDTKVSAGKAYLPVKGYNPNEALKISFNNTTNISENVNKQNAIDNAFYTLSGVRVNNPDKGIKNGKKVVIK